MNLSLSDEDFHEIVSRMLFVSGLLFAFDWYNNQIALSGVLASVAFTSYAVLPSLKGELE